MGLLDDIFGTGIPGSISEVLLQAKAVQRTLELQLAEAPAALPTEAAADAMRGTIDAVLRAQTEISKAQRDVTNLFVINQIVVAGGDINDAFERFVKPASRLVVEAQRGNLPTVAGPPIVRAAVRANSAIIRSMETLSDLEDFKPFFIAAMPATIRLFAAVADKVGEFIVDASAALRTATDAVLKPIRKAREAVDRAVKLSAIGGVAFAIYWFKFRKE